MPQNLKNINLKNRYSLATLIYCFRAFRPEKVFHLAAQINVRESLKNPARDAESNIIGALNVFQNAQNVGAKQIVFTSTGGALYGEAKIRPTPKIIQLFPFRLTASPNSPLKII